MAFSGGGDSLALLLAAHLWGRSHRRPLIALTVDHRLRPESAAWSGFCRARAAALGLDHRTLAWEGEKPTHGLAAAARAARHRLLADAARDAGASVILMGHTADDRAEAALMRRAGGTTPAPRMWAPSPVWPEGRGIFLLRPLLDVRRSDLRRALSTEGEAWIEDPANVDPGSARAKARALLAGGPLGEETDAPSGATPSAPAALLASTEVGPAGDLSIALEALLGAPEAHRFLAAALLCAAGTERPPRGERLARLMARFAAGSPFTATLVGCRVSSDGARAYLVRDSGETRRGALAELPLAEGATSVWDGRFEIRSRASRLTVGALAGRAGRLTPELRRAIAGLPPAARRALPLVVRADGRAALPTVRPDDAVHVVPLAFARLAGTVEAIIDEASLRRMAKPPALY